MNSFTIKDLESLSGIKAHTIRIWEQRYSFLKPQRTDTNIRYYTNEELKKILGNDFEEFKGVFGMTENFEGKINLTRNPQSTIRNLQLKEWKMKLLEERSKRIRPGLDDKGAGCSDGGDLNVFRQIDEHRPRPA